MNGIEWHYIALDRPRQNDFMPVRQDLNGIAVNYRRGDAKSES